MRKLWPAQDRLGGWRRSLDHALGSRQRRALLGVLLGLSGGAFLLGLAGHIPSLGGNVGSTRPDAKERVAQAYGGLPLSFEPNRGQTDARVKFLAHGRGYRLFLTPREAVLDLDAASQTRVADGAQKPARGAMLRMRLVGANPQPSVVGTGQLPGRVNYLLGDDARHWRVGIPTFSKVRYRGVYPGIDLAYYGRQARLEYDFVVRPGADPNAIALRFAGAEHLDLTSRGDLLLRLHSGELRLQKPRIYQELDGLRRDVRGGYVRMSAGAIGFDLGTYDASRPLVIDPVLSYSTYLGGSGDEQGNLIAVDSAGNAYVTGRTASSDFPTTSGALDSNLSGTQDGFVTKLNPSGSALVYSTYLGGSGVDDGETITVDSNFNAYVTGITASSDFPTTSGAVDTTFGGAEDAYVPGFTTSSDFPTSAGAADTTLGGTQDAFVTKLNASGSALAYSTYLGGSADESVPFGIAVDRSFNAYVTSRTFSSDFPTTPDAFDSTLGGTQDAFVTKLNPSGSALAYSTYLGGSGTDLGVGIALDSASPNPSAYIIGATGSSDFPTTPGVFDTSLAGAQTQSCGAATPCDAFVSKIAQSRGRG